MIEDKTQSGKNRFSVAGNLKRLLNHSHCQLERYGISLKKYFSDFTFETTLVAYITVMKLTKSSSKSMSILKFMYESYISPQRRLTKLVKIIFLKKPP